MSEKKLLKIILGLLVVVLLHNLYLNYEIVKVKQDVEIAKIYASRASKYASDAVDFARDAADNAFANNCSYCP
jgi:hypothetical protein